MTATAVPVRPVLASNRPPARLVLTAVAVAAVVTAVMVVSLSIRDILWWLEIDFKVYNLAGAAVLDGVSPYDAVTAEGFEFIYPAFTSLLLVPVGLLSVDVGYAVWTFLTVLALQAAVWLALGFVAPESPARRAKLAILATVVTIPTAAMLMHLSVGQINVFLMLVILADLLWRPGRLQGLGIGIAAGMKLLPLIFVAYLLLTGRIRAAVVSMVAFAATVLVGFVVLPGPSAAWWGTLMLNTGRMTPDGAASFNQSMRGVLGTLPGFLSATWFWLILAILVGVAGLAISVWAGRRGMAAAGVFACAVTSLLVSPVSWPDHWVWLVPGLAIWFWWARERRSPRHIWGVTLVLLMLSASGVLLFLLVALTPALPEASALMPGTMAAYVVLSGLTLLTCLGFLGTLAAVLRRKDRELVSVRR